ncbi:MAG: TetR/AcrR family transcriptional regulator [Spirochaetaceae bacterium]|jgi:AcrR family transcriptional regulator|nr:TetR/AcrR family transcriptional regulator [Spirochaetaceae bacterium]
MTKSDIIAAAFCAWGRELYQTTSLTMLARTLGVTKPALYRHFKNKQALLKGMYESFLDDYVTAIKPHYDRAIEAADPREGLLIFTRAVIDYYGRNMDAFIFSLIKVYADLEIGSMREQLLVRGMDMRKLGRLEENRDCYPSTIHLLIATLTFGVAFFHCYGHRPEETPSEAAIQELITSLEEKASRGLGFNREWVDGIDYEQLERWAVERAIEPQEEDELLRAVAGAVAEAGPWNASMDMVARRSGLSKSGLYAHFRSKQDMLRQLFMIEFQRMADYAELCVRESTVPGEQLYLAIISIGVYLRSRREILIAMDWVRTRRFDLGLTIPPRIYNIFSDIRIPQPGAGETLPEQSVQWILFLIVNTLMRRSVGTDFPGIANDSFRRLYRFIVLGIQGFNL